MSSIKMIVTFLVLVAVGCDSFQVANVGQDPQQKSQQQTKQEQEKQDEQDSDKGVLKQASQLLDNAAKSGTEGATMAKDWLQEKFSDVYDSSSQIADDTSGWVNDTYKSLKDQGLTHAGSATQWLTDDIRAIGSWEYKVISLNANDSVEAIEAKLNEHGGKKWECFHVVEGAESMKLMFKRAKRSYLKNGPLKDLMKLVPLMGGGGGADGQE